LRTRIVVAAESKSRKNWR